MQFDAFAKIDKSAKDPVEKQMKFDARTANGHEGLLHNSNMSSGGVLPGMTSECRFSGVNNV